MTTPTVLIHGYALTKVTRESAQKLFLTRTVGIVAIHVRETDQWVIKGTADLRARLLGVLRGDVGAALKRAFGKTVMEQVDVYYSNQIGKALAVMALGQARLFDPRDQSREARRTDVNKEAIHAYLRKHMGPHMQAEERWSFIGERGEEPHLFHKAVDALLSNVSSIQYDKAIPKAAIDKVKIKTIVAKHVGYKRAMVALMGDLAGLVLLEPRFTSIGEHCILEDNTLGIRMLEVMLDGNPDLDAEVMETMRSLAGVMVGAGYELRMLVEQDVDAIPMLCYINEAMPVQSVLLAECAMAVATKVGVPDIFKRFRTKEFTDV